MARDLTREARALVNGDEPTERLPIERLLPSTPSTSAAELSEAKRDWLLARVAVMLIDAAKMLDPLTRIVMARVLAILSLIAATGITAYTIHLTQGWERVAMAVAFLGLAAWLMRRAQG